MLPENSKKKQLRGVITAVGRGYQRDDGTYRALPVVVGDTVAFTEFAGNEIQDGTDYYVILQMSDVLAKLVV